MATDRATKKVPEMLPPELYPKVDHLVTEDRAPVKDIFSEKQQRLLTEPLYSSWAALGQQRPFVVMANVALHYSLRRPPFVPTALLSLDVELPADLRSKPNRSYILWEYGQPPDLVVETVSKREGGEDTERLAGYTWIGVPYSVIFDPERLLGPEVLRAYRLVDRLYQKIDEPLWFPGVALGLRLWQGRYEDHEDTWLRWVDAEGRLIPTGRERAEAERERADRLAEQLRRLGVEPQGR
jgi:Uma2 family endonuclease